jgi:hypothetical protein
MSHNSVTDDYLATRRTQWPTYIGGLGRRSRQYVDTTLLPRGIAQDWVASLPNVTVKVWVLPLWLTPRETLSSGR